MQLVEIMGGHAADGIAATNGAALMMVTFSKWWNVALYIVWFVALWFHLTHGVWSMFQSVGAANDKWYPRLKFASNVVSTLILLGFAAVAIYCFVQTQTNPEIIDEYIALEQKELLLFV